jgi:hypothetical protein
MVLNLLNLRVNIVRIMGLRGLKQRKVEVT